MTQCGSQRIYTIKSASPKLQPNSADTDPTVFWMHDLQEHHGLTFDYTHLSDLPGLVTLFKRSLTGFVAYDQATGSANAALIRWCDILLFFRLILDCFSTVFRLIWGDFYAQRRLRRRHFSGNTSHGSTPAVAGSDLNCI